METPRLTALAIDDNADNLVTLQAIVKDALPTCRLVTASNGSRGLELALAEDPDVILLDIVMPGMDGYEVCRRLKADERLRPIPVVFLTALRTDRDSRIRALDSGAEGFLSKPLDDLELVAKVRNMAKVKLSTVMQRDEKTRLASLVAERTKSLQQSRRSLLNAMDDLTVENAARKMAEAEAHREQVLSNTIIDSIPGTFYLLDEHGRYARWNSYQRDIILGKPEDQIAGMAAIDTIHPEDRALIQARIANVLRDGKAESVEGRVLLHGGPAFIWMLMTGWRMTIAGRPFLVGTGINITTRKQAELETAKSRDLLANLARLVPGVIYQYRLYPDGRSAFPYSSPGMNDIYEVTPEEVREDATPVFGRLHPEDSDRVSATILESARTLATFYCEFRVVLPRQGLRWRWSQAQPERMPDGGTVWHGIISDITERKRAEEERLRLSTAMEQASETVIITDTAGRIQYANPAFTAITGYTRAEVLGQNPRLLKSGKQDAAFYRQLWETLAAGQIWQGRFSNQRKDGTLYTEEASISPVRDTAGEIVNYVAVKRDITRELELESQFLQAQKMEAVGRLAGGVAHDFNNLLMGIMGYAELCRDQVEPGHPVREWVDEITLAVKRSSDITRQLLAFARKQTIEPKILDLNDAVGGMLKLLQRLISEDIKLVWRPGAGLPPVKIDPSQVDQILANLCVNARDAIAGTGEITLKTGSLAVDVDYGAEHPDAIPGAYVFLAVSDTGCGMDQKTLAQVFEPFFTTKGLGKGTGLGLATVYGIVKQNHGFIQVTSEPGRGTTFKICLPQAAGEIAPATVTRQAEAPPRGRGETILLVEDEKSLRVTCGRFLNALGYNVLMAETPGEALTLADRHPGDLQLLFTDVVMPGMDGKQLAARLSAARPGLKVLFMSGYTDDVITQHGVLDDGVQFLAKPFTRDDLARKVRKVLEPTLTPNPT